VEASPWSLDTAMVNNTLVVMDTLYNLVRKVID
jgi:hypothetical protein